MDEQRLIDIETKLAFQEEALRQLNDTLIDQQARVADLERLCRELAARIARISEGAEKGSAAEEIPPHY
ncbi:SlyX family protein [Sinimarinibacterium thermocellulolyticum]|uniref:SlyX family protein n=1 Tax=Sinimarinibacterium thermocellulolyticum TaxID=3170016 RepID=A0ABV2ACS9_9GAMM